MVSIHIEPNDDSQTKIVGKKNIIQVMNSSGKILDKELETEYSTFLDLHEEISTYLQQYESQGK